MANRPWGYGPTKLSLGSDGKVFKSNGFESLNGTERRVTRTGVRLNTANHDTSNIQYWTDSRLPVLFRYNYAEMYNQIVIPKGRMVAVDADVKSKAENPEIFLNVLTLANGGSPVRLRKVTDVYPAAAPDGIISADGATKPLANTDTEWTPVAADAYTEKYYKPFANGGNDAIMKANGLEKDEFTGLVKKDGKPVLNHRAGNVPVGMLVRNEYTRDEDAFNGMMPGAIKTDILVELPHFLHKDKAELNPWGSVYGKLVPGDLVKSDENGRVVRSPLSDEAEVAKMNMVEYHNELRQVIGQVHEVSPNLVPAGSTKWAKWAVSDMENFVEYDNGQGYGFTNRRGEDIYDVPAYYRSMDGYEYNELYNEHDLNMTAGNAKLDVYDSRFGAKYEYPGIIGLTDGRNVAKSERKDVVLGFMQAAAPNQEYVDFNFRVPDRFVEPNTTQISLGGGAYTPLTVGAVLNNTFQVVYYNHQNGLIRLRVTDKAAATAAIAAGKEGRLEVKVSYMKAGLAGVPTFMDWDGCVGSAKILLQK